MAAKELPPDFADLAPYASEWALPTERERHQKRLASSLPAVRAFNDAVYPRMDAIVAYLNRFPLQEMPPAAANLLNLARAYMETSHPVDLNWPTTDLEDAFPPARFEYLPPSA